MTRNALRTLTAELDSWAEAGRTIALWLRDDDAVAPSPALSRLSRLSERFALPVLLAVIPMLAQPDLARALAAAPTLLPCQHGCWHRSHAPGGGKKSEFGCEREPDQVRAELILARQRLGDTLGSSVLPVFAPPWNRIAPGIAAMLPDLGFVGLSCFRGFGTGPEAGPAVVNTDIDIMDWHGGRVGRPTVDLALEIGEQLLAKRRHPTGDGVLGLLLHHRDHDDTAWLAVESLLATLAAHPAVRLTDPRQLFSLPIAA